MRPCLLTTCLASFVAGSMLGCPSEKPAPGAKPAETSTASSTRSLPSPSTTSPVRSPGPAFERFAMPGVQGLIVGESEAGQFYAALTGDTSPRYWTPEKRHLIDLETRLPAFLRGKAKPNSPLRENLRSYRRQYIGIDRSGEQVIHANFFCETNRRDWTRQPISVKDGGDCYFQLEFEPNKRKFSRLHIHGEG